MKRSRWEVRSAFITDVARQDALGEKNWQPFAVYEGQIFYKKVVEFTPAKKSSRPCSLTS